MELHLFGKRALVTGSSSGIGRGIALALAAEGVEVIVHGRNEERTIATASEILANGGKAHVAIGDLSVDAGAAEVILAVEAACGGIDVLVNNIGGNEAAGGGLTGWFNDTPEVWTGTMQQNLVAPVRMIHAFVPAMRERGWGRVINISSGGGAQPTPQAAAYCAAKAAVNNLTVSLSMELARSGVTVNSVSPGCTRTSMFEGTLKRMAEANGWEGDLDEFEKKFMDIGLFACSSVRYGRPDEVGALVALLASPVSGFINGADYRIDGGQVQSVN